MVVVGGVGVCVRLVSFIVWCGGGGGVLLFCCWQQRGVRRAFLKFCLTWRDKGKIGGTGRRDVG